LRNVAVDDSAPSLTVCGQRFAEISRCAVFGAPCITNYIFVKLTIRIHFAYIPSFPLEASTLTAETCVVNYTLRLNLSLNSVQGRNCLRWFLSGSSGMVTGDWCL